MTLTEKMNGLIENVINEYEYICNSDCTDRIIDEFAKSLADEDEELFDELVKTATNYLDKNYNKVCELDSYANYTCYYSIKKFDGIESLETYFNIGE